jgi:hypothetical protein
VPIESLALSETIRDDRGWIVVLDGRGLAIECGAVPCGSTIPGPARRRSWRTASRSSSVAGGRSMFATAARAEVPQRGGLLLG